MLRTPQVLKVVLYMPHLEVVLVSEVVFCGLQRVMEVVKGYRRVFQALIMLCMPRTLEVL